MKNDIVLVSCFLALSLSCLDNPRDNPFDGWKDIASGSAETTDTTPPVPGSSGTVTLSIVNNTAGSAPSGASGNPLCYSFFSVFCKFSTCPESSSESWRNE